MSNKQELKPLFRNVDIVSTSTFQYGQQLETKTFFNHINDYLMDERLVNKNLNDEIFDLNFSRMNLETIFENRVLYKISTTIQNLLSNIRYISTDLQNEVKEFEVENEDVCNYTLNYISIIDTTKQIVYNIKEQMPWVFDISMYFMLSEGDFKSKELINISILSIIYNYIDINIEIPDKSKEAIELYQKYNDKIVDLCKQYVININTIIDELIYEANNIYAPLGNNNIKEQKSLKK